MERAALHLGRSTGCLQHLPAHPCAIPAERTARGWCFPAELCLLLWHFSSASIHLIPCRASSVHATTRATAPAWAQPPPAASPARGTRKLQSRDRKSANPRSWHSGATLGLSVATGEDPWHAAHPGYHAQPRHPSSFPEPEHQHHARLRAAALPPPASHPCHPQGNFRAGLTPGCSKHRAQTRILFSFKLLLFCFKPHFPPVKFCFNPNRIAAPSSPLQHPPAAAMAGDPGVTCAEGVRHPPGEPLRAPGGRGSKEPPPEHPSPLPASPVPPTALPSPLPGRDPDGPRLPPSPREEQRAGRGGPGWILQRWEGAGEDLEGEAGS